MNKFIKNHYFCCLIVENTCPKAGVFMLIKQTNPLESLNCVISETVDNLEKLKKKPADFTRNRKLNAETVLAIPRRIRSPEVVRRGFMSNFLFQNIANIFNAPQEVIDIIKTLPNAPEGELARLTTEMREELSVNSDGEIILSGDDVSDITERIFDDPIYGEITEVIEKKIDEIANENTPENKAVETLKDAFKKGLVTPIMDAAENYGDELKGRDINQIQKRLEQEANQIKSLSANTEHIPFRKAFWRRSATTSSPALKKPEKRKSRSTRNTTLKYRRSRIPSPKSCPRSLRKRSRSFVRMS